MKVNNTDYDINSLLDDLDIENNLHTYVVNDIYLSNKQINVLKRNNINYKKYTNLSTLIYDIEEYLNDGNDDLELENLLDELAEFNYYMNTKKQEISYFFTNCLVLFF